MRRTSRGLFLLVSAGLIVVGALGVAATHGPAVSQHVATNDPGPNTTAP